MNIASHGKAIRRIRKIRGLSQSELGDGIGGQSFISRIEHGLVLPSIDTLLIIANRLEVSLEYLLESFRTENFQHITNKKKELRYLVGQVLYPEALQISKNELKAYNSDVDYVCFLKWVEAISEYKLGKIRYQQCIVKLHEILESKDTYFSDRNLFLDVQSSIATVYLSAGMLQQAIKNYEKIIEDNFIYTDENFKVIVLYNYANALKRNGLFKKGIEISEKAISMAKISGKSVVIGPLYYILGECKEGLHFHFDEIKACFDKAIYFFKAYDRLDLIEIMKKEHKKYYDE